MINNNDYSIFSFVRYAKDSNDFTVIILNLTPMVHHNFRIGVPKKGKYYEIINSDYGVYGGSNLFNGDNMFSHDIPMHNMDQSIDMVLSPLSITIIKCGD